MRHHQTGAAYVFGYGIAVLLGFTAWGFLVGVVVGFTAIGKGLIGTPGLIILFGLDPVVAVGSMAVGGFVMMLSATYQHARAGNVAFRIAFLYLAAALPTSYLAAYAATEINEIVPLKTTIGVIIVLSTVLLFYRYVIARPKPRELSLPRWKFVAAPFIGAVMGVLTGATSISGSVIVIVFIMVLLLPSPVAIGTTSMVAALSLLIASVAHLQRGNIDWAVVGAMIPGIVLGSAFGARYVNRVPRQALRIVILVALFFAGVMVLFD